MTIDAKTAAAAHSTASSTLDSLEKHIFIDAPRARVWRALVTPAEFAEWFGVTLQGDFTPGAVIRGRIKMKEYSHLEFSFVIDRIEPESLMSFKWHPYAVDPTVDYSQEPFTTIVFKLAEQNGGTRVSVTESGFAGIPAHRRAEAFRMNTQGWEQQLQNIAKHVATG